MVGVDAVLTLGAPGQAPLKSTGTGSSTFNRVWTTLGVPCLTLPFGKGEAELPLGVQFVGALNEDCQLLALGTKFEAIFADQPSV
jgi:amidase